MDQVSLTLIAAALLLYSVVSGRLSGTMVTGPLVFVGFGFLVGAGGLGVVDLDLGHAGIHVIAELTLVLVLFTDAVRIDLGTVRRDHRLPVRMLAVGLPLTIVCGAVTAAVLFPSFSFWEAALLAALLAPTDAALGQSVVSASAVPVRVRQAINIESGLNDGIALPAVLLCAALAAAGSDGVETSRWVEFALLQVTLGPLAGITFGYLGARLLDEAEQRGWVDDALQGVGILSLALLTFVATELIGGNGFIAAFVSGMTFGDTVRHPCTFLFEFMETEGQLLMLITFFVFGAALLPEGLTYVGPATVVYALLSLTIVRMLPIALSLVGTGVRLPTRLFLGWFGPRGLASILFVLLILEEAEITHHGELLSVTVFTVAVSVLLHGLTSAPLAGWYGRLASQMGECEETRPAVELPLRDGHSPTNQSQRG